jgi:hypothetical protein
MVIYNAPAIAGFTEKERTKVGMAVLFYALPACSRQENRGKNEYVVFLHNCFILQVKINQIDLPFSGMQSFVRCSACRLAYAK